MIDPTLLSLGAALCLGLSSALQKHGATAALGLAPVPPRWRTTWARLRSLLCDWRWLLGGALGSGGTLLYLRALGLGELARVQPLMSLTLVVAAVAGVMWLGERLAPLEWLGLGLVIVGAVLVGSAAERLPAVASARAGVPVFPGLVFVALLTALFRYHAARALPELLFSTAAGLCFGAGTVLIKLTVHATLGRAGAAAGTLDRLLWLLLASPLFWVTLASQLVALVVFQVALARGRVAVVNTLSTLSGTALPVLAGAGLFHEAVTPQGQIGLSILFLGSVPLLLHQARLSRRTPREDASLPNGPSDGSPQTVKGAGPDGKGRHSP